LAVKRNILVFYVSRERSSATGMNPVSIAERRE
jgi:hypothetical protein